MKIYFSRIPPPKLCCRSPSPTTTLKWGCAAVLDWAREQFARNLRLPAAATILNYYCLPPELLLPLLTFVCT